MVLSKCIWDWQSKREKNERKNKENKAFFY